MQRVNLNTVLDMLRMKEPTAPTERELNTAAAYMYLWPNDGATLNKFRSSPNCGSCRAALIELLAADPGRVKAFLKRVNPTEEYTVDVEASGPIGRERAAMPAGQHSVVGEVHDIADSAEAYGKFVKEIRLRGGRYSGLSVRQLEPGKVRIYFY